MDVKIDDICRDLGISNSTFYNWRSKYTGMEVSEAKRLRELEKENAKLKKLLTDTVADMGEFLATSERSIYRLCKNEYNVSPAQLLKHLRLDRASQLLIDTNAPIKMIAQRACFSSSEAFNKSFLRTFGITLNTYRLNSRSGSLIPTPTQVG